MMKDEQDGVVRIPVRRAISNRDSQDFQDCRDDAARARCMGVMNRTGTDAGEILVNPLIL